MHRVTPISYAQLTSKMQDEGFLGNYCSLLNDSFSGRQGTGNGGRKQYHGPTDVDQEPPIIYHAVPFIGHILGPFWNGMNYYAKITYRLDSFYLFKRFNVDPILTSQ